MRQEKIYLSEIIKWHTANQGLSENFGLPENHVITYPRAIELCDASNISMITHKYKEKTESLLATTLSKVIILPKDFLRPSFDLAGKAFLYHPNPKELLILFCKEFLGFGADNIGTSIHPSAIIEEGAKIGANCILEANSFISGNSEIGNNCTIGANTVIKNTTIANNIIIGSNNTIGENGFGYSKNEIGEAELFPHYGRVIIQDNVHIGNNTCIDRGSLSDTVIMKGVKIDNLVHIAHNVIVGENTFVIACSMIGGSVVIGENCWVAPSSTVRNAITIGKNATIGLASTVVKNVEANEIVLGNPAMSKEDFLIIRQDQNRLISEQKNKT